MPPQKKQKSPKAKKEDVERQKRILSAQERILSIKHMLLSIIEAMIEKNISKEWFLENCTKLCHADYDDVVQERSIEHLCGYPLCSNIITQAPKQKYHISVVSNKVYDLTERKCFCSNHCYKASMYLKAQLSPVPLYMRKEEKIKVYLLSDCDNRGSAGEEVIFHQKIPQEEIDKVYNEEQASTDLYNMLNEEVKKCADSLDNLQIKEHVFEKQFVFGEETPKKSDSSQHDDKSESDSEKDIDSDDSIDEKLFPTHDNMEALSHKHMPIPKKIKKSVLIPPLKPETTKSKPVKELSLNFVFKVFKDWMTEDTIKYLLGEKYVYGIKADSLFKKMTSNDPVTPEKLSSIKDEYIKLCLKIDSLPDDDDDDEDNLYNFADIGMVSESKTSSVSKTFNREDSTEKKVFKRRPKGKSKEKTKHVTFAPEVKTPVQEAELKVGEIKDVPVLEDVISQESPANSSLPEPAALPLVDSVSQNILRRQVLTGRLKSVYSELLPIIGLHYTDVREDVRKFVDTLSLTPTNILFKPKEWKLISLVLYRILTKTVSKHLQDELQFVKMCDDPFIPVSIDVSRLEKIVSELLSPENVIQLK